MIKAFFRNDWISYVTLGVGISALGLEYFFQGHSGTQVLMHGLTGAFIGGLVDTFAVNKVFLAMEEKRDVLADEIGAYIGKEVINKHFVEKKIDDLLNDPKNIKILHDKINSEFKDDAAVKSFLVSNWNKVEKGVLEQIANYDLSPETTSSVSSLFTDEAITKNFYHCLSKAMIEVCDDPKLVPAIKDTIKISDSTLAKMFSGTVVDAIMQKLRSSAKDLDAKAKGSFEGSAEANRVMYQFMEIGKRGGVTFIEAWNSLSHQKRIAGVKALTHYLKEPLFDAITSFVVHEIDRIKEVDALWKYDPAKQLVELIGEQVDHDFPVLVSGVVSSALKGFDPRQFRTTLEEKTLPIFNNIRLNGLIAGGVVGSAFGGILYFITKG